MDPSINAGRALLAALVAAASTVFNYGSTVTSATEAMVWFGFVLCGVYLVLTLFDAVVERVWQ